MKLKVEGLKFAPELNPRPELDRSQLDSLATSLRELTQLKPIEVVRRGDRWLVSDGWRRVLAARQIGWKEIEGTEVPDDGRRHLVNLADLVQRQDLSVIEEAAAVRRELQAIVVRRGIKEGTSRTALANALGKSTSWITSRVEMAKLTDVVEEKEVFKERSVRELQALQKVSKKVRPEVVKELAEKARKLTITQTGKAAKILEKTPTMPVAEAVAKAKETPGGGLLNLTIRLPNKIMDILEKVSGTYNMTKGGYVRFVVETNLAGHASLMGAIKG